MSLAVSKDVQDELLAIRADLETAMLRFIRDKHYGAAERMLVIVDRSLHNLIRDAALVTAISDEPSVLSLMSSGGETSTTSPPASSNQRSDADNHAVSLGLRVSR